MNHTPSQTQTRITVLVGGCFDLLHFGHISFLKAAKALGNYLVVALESDYNVRRMKGENRPIHTQDQRREILESLRAVDEVISLPMTKSDQDYYDLVNKINPQVIALTAGDPNEDKKRQQAESIGARVEIIPKITSPSTSELTAMLAKE